MESYDILIVGGGAAGIAAAEAAYSEGCESILLVDRGASLGGVLKQCAHRGFDAGLTGTEYISKLTVDFPSEIKVYLNSTVVSVNTERRARIVGAQIGERTVAFKKLILATGCREIAMGALPIAGTRPKGVYTAGQMQEMINLHGHIPKGPLIILGSGDLGLIMAEQISSMGIDVSLVEQNDRCGGMPKNQRFLKEKAVGLYLSSTVSQVHGSGTLEGVTLSDGRYIPCGTLLIAVGLVPERELARDIERESWLECCGNCRKVYPMVEAVVEDGRLTAKALYQKL